MYVLTFLIIGLIAGWLAGVIVRGRGLGIIGDIIVGIIGSFFGGYLFSFIGITAYGFWGSFAMSVVGAISFLFLVGLFTRPRKLKEHRS